MEKMFTTLRNFCRKHQHTLLLSVFLGALGIMCLGTLSRGGSAAPGGTISLTTLAVAVTENFDTLASTGTPEMSTLPTSWDSAESGTNANTTYGTGTGSSATGNTYSFGAAGSGERAFGGLQSGSLIPLIGASFTNNTGQAIKSVEITYTGEQWRLGTTGRTDRLDFQISTDATSLTTGTYSDINSLDFVAPITAGTVGALDGNNAANRATVSSTIGGLDIANGATFWIRWTDLNASSSDDGLAIDDFFLTPTDVIIPPPLTINDVFVLEGDSGLPTQAVFTVSLAYPAADDVTFDAASADDTAQDGLTVGEDFDYNFTSLTGQTIPKGLTTKQIFVFVNRDTTVEPDETFFVNITNISATATAGDVQGLGTIITDDIPITFIHDIQGSAEAPAITGTVRIDALVTSDHQGDANLSGFFIQEEDADADADPLTSEGMFVFDGANPAVDVSVGQHVTIVGTVINFPDNTAGLTEISPLAGVTINSSGNPLPASVLVALPVATSPAADLERFEGMRIAFNQDLFVTNVIDLGTFGEVTVSADAPLYIPTNSVDPNDAPASGTSTSGAGNVAAVTAQQSLNDRSRIIIDDGTSRTNANPNKPLNPIPFLIGSGTDATLRRGDIISNPAAILSFGFGNYRLEQASNGTLTFTAGNPRPFPPPPVGNSNLRIGSANVENYFHAVPSGTGRGASNATELTRQTDKLAQALAGLNADVIALIELEKAGGNAAAVNLANALTALGTVGTWAAVPDLVTFVGTDTEIKNGLIYRTSTISLVGSPFTDLAAAAGTYSRDPLTQIFMLNATSRAFAVSVHHGRSKSCTGATGLDTDQGDGQSCFNDRRRSQSTALVTFLNNLSSTVQDIVVVGDFNSYAEEDPVDVFRAAGYSDLIGQFVLPFNRYSFTFNAEGGALDHAMANASMAGKATGADIWHINADEPDIFDYNTESKPDDRYAATAYRSADHDPLVLSFNLAGPTAANGVVSGRIQTAEGAPIAGTVIYLDGTQNRKTITDSDGVYRFEGVETTGFYTVTPARANFSFSPTTRSFSQVGERTEAGFTGAGAGEISNPLDTPEYFVRQQYVDLLGREPDEAGFNYWSDRILECGSNSACVMARRRDVAAAFFIEQEFQRTGSFIYGLYKGALGRRPQYAEFSVDRQQVVEGPTLEATKQALAQSFVGRAEFVNRYPANQGAAEFVEALLSTVLQTSGVDLSSQRANLLARYQAGTDLSESRSLVIRELVESAAFRQAEYNAAFVLTEYFSYLRRDPDQGGYDFWLQVLNNREQGNFQGMVCGFITSAEYQLRFSSIVSHTNRECGSGP